MPADALLRGIALFNGGDFFAAHEALEDVWRESSGRERRFLQGLIQIAVALHHHATGNLTGARSLLARGAEKLADYPPVYAGIAVAPLAEAVAAWSGYLGGGGEQPPFPRILSAQEGSAREC